MAEARRRRRRSLPESVSINTPISKAVINGRRGAFRGLASQSLTESGYVVTFRFEGTQNEMIAEWGSWARAGAVCVYNERHGGMADLEVRLSWIPSSVAEVPISTWELDNHTVEKDLLEADFPNPGTVGPISQENRKVISNAIANPPADPIHQPVFEDVSGTADAAIAIYDLMCANVRAFPFEASVIRHTQTVSNIYTVKASFFNTGRIISSASLPALEGVPANLLFSVPATPAPTQFIETPGDLQYGWRKARPNISKLALQKWQIVQNYELGLWAIAIHGTVL